MTAEAAGVAERLTDGGRAMLLHIARVRPLRPPFPSEALGTFHLFELLKEALVAETSPHQFQASPLGLAVAHILREQEKTK